MTRTFRRELFSEFLGPLAVVLGVFAVAAFWPLDGGSVQSAVAVDVAMPSALSGGGGGVERPAVLPSVSPASATGADRAVTTNERPAPSLQGRS